MLRASVLLSPLALDYSKFDQGSIVFFAFLFFPNVYYVERMLCRHLIFLTLPTPVRLNPLLLASLSPPHCHLLPATLAQNNG